MSEIRDPVTTAFDFQRSAIEQSKRAVEQSVDLQKRTARAFVNSLDAQQSAQKQTTEVLESAIEASLTAFKASAPGNAAGNVEEFERVLEEQFRTADEIQDESWASMKRALEEGVEAYDSIADAYLETVDASFDALLEANERAEGQMTQAVAAAEEAVEIEVEESE